MPLDAFDGPLADMNVMLRSISMPVLRLEELVGCRLYTGPRAPVSAIPCRGVAVRLHPPRRPAPPLQFS